LAGGAECGVEIPDVGDLASCGALKAFGGQADGLTSGEHLGLSNEAGGNHQTLGHTDGGTVVSNTHIKSCATESRCAKRSGDLEFRLFLEGRHIEQDSAGLIDGVVAGERRTLIVDAGPTADDEAWAVVDRAVRNELRHHFRPEFLNRVDDIIVFRPLSRDDIRHIVDLQLAKLEKLLADRKLGLEVTPEARAYLAELGYDPVYGARPLKRVVQQRLQNPIALEVLEGHFPEGSTIRVVRAGDELRFTSTAGNPERFGA